MAGKAHADKVLVERLADSTAARIDALCEYALAVPGIADVLTKCPPRKLAAKLKKLLSLHACLSCWQEFSSANAVCKHLLAETEHIYPKHLLAAEEAKVAALLSLDDSRAADSELCSKVKLVFALKRAMLVHVHR